MRLLTKLLIVCCTFFYTNGQSTLPNIEVTDNQGLNNILVDCDYPLDANRCFVLQANYTVINETTSYNVNTIPFTNLSGLTNETIVSISGDDKWSSALQLPFDFCFYNEGHSEFLIGDNGIITFNTALALGDSPYFAGTIPNASMPTNAIFGVYHDLTNDNNVFGCTDNPLTPQNECGEIKTYIIGTAPQRAFVISYENLNHFNCEVSRSTSQIVLYETSNTIDVYVQEKPINCEADPNLYRKNALIGIQNIDGSAATTPVNRNTSIWSTTNEAWRFTPNGIPLTTVQWTDANGTLIATGDEITICPEQSTNYTATATYDICIGGDVVLEDTINIEIDLSFPVAIDNEQIVCDINQIGEEQIDLTTYQPIMVGTQTGLVLSYYNTLADAQSDTNLIVSPNVYLLTNPTETIYVRLQRGIGCFDIGTLTINLEELATSQLTEIALCDVANDNSELVTFSNYTAQIIGVQTGVNISYHLTQNDADNNINPILDLITANGDSVFVRLSLQPDSTCPNVVEIPINLLPVPIVAPIEVTLCSNIAIYDLTQHESDIQTNNIETLNYTYHLYEVWALNNINPFDPTSTTNPIDPEFYVLNSIAQIWVRSYTSSGCVEVFPINFTYIQGVAVQNDTQVSSGTIFDLTNSIADMVANLTGITVQYYDSLIGAQTQNVSNLIADPVNFGVTNPDTEVFIVFTNTASGCVTIGTIGLESVGFGGGGGNGAFQVCDSANDSQEMVTLSDYDAGLIAGYDDEQYMVVSYHILQTDANNNLNPITQINITVPTIIYARVSLVFEGVELDFNVIEIDLDFQTTILLNSITDVICDEFGNNQEILDITQYETQITTVTGATFEYQYTNGATINNPTTFNVIGPTQIINVLVTTPDGCTTETTIIITFHLLIPTTNTVIEECDADNNNEELFNLDDALPNVNINFASYVNSYYLTEVEAEIGDISTAITNPNTYLVTVNTSVYVRLFNSTTTCYAIAQIDLTIVPVPEILMDSMIICDFENDAIENNYDLTQFNTNILGAQTGVNLMYYNTLDDANNQVNSITTTNITNNTTVYVNLSAADGCIITGSITINLQTSPIVNDINIIVCDNFTDGQETYNLTLSNTDIIADTVNHSFQYYTLEANAVNNTGAISSSYLITSVPQTLYVRVTNNVTGCFSIANMSLDFTFPVTVQDTELTACDDDFNLSEEFDLTTAIPDMLADTTGLDITYFSDEIGAQTANATFLITTPQNHNTASETDTVFVRFFDPLTECFSIGKIVLRVLATPKLIDGIFEICDTDFDSFYTLDLADLNPIIIQNQTNLIFTYYTSLIDAENETGEINTITNYAIPNNNHTIFIRVLNTFGCWSVASVNIIIRASITVETVTETMEECDDDLNGFSFFDLTAFENLFTTETGAAFRYFNTEMDANLEQNEIPNPTVHQNTNPNSQTIFVRASLLDKCDAITSFVISTIHITPPTLSEAVFCSGTSVTLDIGSNYTTYDWSTTETTQTIEVFVAGTYSVTLTDSDGCIGTFNVVVTELPLPQVVPTSITECDYDGVADGLMQFNLNDYNDQLTGNNNNVTTHFFLSQNDLDNDINEQNALFTNTTNQQILFVKIVDNTTGCFDFTQLTLNSSFVVLTPNTYEICDTDFDGNYTFNLAEINSLVVANITNLLFEYYTSQTDAENQNNAIFGDYTIPNNNHDVFVRVENTLGCVYVTTVEILHEEITSVEVVTDILEACDDDENNYTTFNLTAFQNLFTTEIGATFRYYNTQDDAKLEQNEILNPTNHQNIAPNTQSIFVRVSIAGKCDNITSFTIQTIHIIHPTLTEATFCSGTSVFLDIGSDYQSYFWSTGEITQTIEVSVAETYSVTLVDSNGCTNTFSVEVVELPLPEAYNFSVLECDNYGVSDNFMLFDLTIYNNDLTGNNTNVSTHFYLSQNDLDNNLNEINTSFANTTNPQILFVKVQDNITNCYSSSQLTLEVSSIDPRSALLELCDELNSEDGINTFNLTMANAQVTQSLPIDTEVIYYETLNDAELQQNQLNTNYTNTNPYMQIVYARVENEDGCFGIDEVLLIVNDLPNIETTEELIYCLNNYPETIELTGGIINDSPSNYYYLWNTGENTSTIQINEIGIYSVTITSTEGCSKIREISVLPSNTATIESIDIDDAIEINTITVYVSGEGNYEYALDDENSTYQDSNIFTNVQGGLHTVYVRDKNECGVISEVISVISIPKFFTPNNDRANDTWIPKGLNAEFQNNVSIYIYDRYGKLLKQLDPFGIGWNGIYNNNLMPTSDYWYTIEFIENFSGKQRLLKGHFTLKR